jgi:anti-anti-sigma factor
MATPLEIALLPGGRIAVAGEIDLGNADRFAAAVLGARADRAGVVLDVSALTFIDSTGIRALVTIAKASHCEVVLLGARSNVAKALRLVGLGVDNPWIRLEPTEVLEKNKT